MTWLPPRKGKPRRKAPERVEYRNRKVRPDAARERAHMERVAEMGCCVCGRPATIHHVTGYADRPGRALRSDKRVVPLCPVHHQIQHGPRESVEALGHRGFYREHHIDLMALAEHLWELTCARS